MKAGESSDTPVIPPHLSVVIPAHNAAKTIGEQISALTSQQTDFAFEVIVVNNNSSDTTADIVSTMTGLRVPVRAIDAPDRNTPGYARNVGAAAAKSALLAFCDADDVVDGGFVQAMIRALSTREATMGVIDYTKLNPSWLQAARGSRSVSELTSMDGVFPYVVTACFGIRRSSFDAAGGFDETMRYGQDGEFAWRLHQNNIRVGFTKEAVVHYRLRPSVRANFAQARNWGRARMVIRARMKEAGQPPTGNVKWKNLVWLLRHAPATLVPSGRVRWVVVAGDLLGEIEGSISAGSS